MKPHLYKRGNHWYCRRFDTSDSTGWGETPQDAYWHWFRQNFKLEAQ